MLKLPYAASGLDRGGPRRGDELWIGGLLADPATEIIPMWRDRCLTTGAGPVRRCVAEAAELLTAAGQPDEPAAVRLAGAGATSDIRALLIEGWLAEGG